MTVPPVAYDATSSTFTSSVSYRVAIPTHFGNLFDAVLSWPLGGSSSAVIVVNSFVQIDILADNSSSMLIGAEPSDIEALQNLTLCPPQPIGADTGHGGNSPGYAEYSWNFSNGTYGLAGGQTIPTAANPGAPGGACDTAFTGDVGGAGGTYSGDLGECLNPTALKGTIVNLPETYLPPGIAMPLDSAGFCPAGYGTPDNPGGKYLPRTDPVTGKTGNVPQSPCGFACHGNYTPNDYYTLLQTARAKGATINLRFDVVQNAMAQVVANLQTAAQKSGIPNQFSLGVFTFNSAIAQVHPANAGGPFVEADSNLSQGLADIRNIQAPAVADQANTDFPDAMASLASNVQPGGDGTTPTTPRKNLFIVTDGLEDYSPANRSIGQMTSPLNETTCAALKAKNYAIYVLYTPYYPLPNPFYLQNAKAAVEAPITDPGLSIAAGLQACASRASYYYQASSVADINSAMQQMLASALNLPGRLSH